MCSSRQEMPPSSKDVTTLINEWIDGHQGAMEELIPKIYDELKKLAKHYLRSERPNHTLQTTALVNEAYIRLVNDKSIRKNKSRAYFFGIAAQMMRRILVEYARRHRALKRGGGHVLSLEGVGDLPKEKSADLVALDDALIDLASFDPQKSQIVELRFFGGLSIAETAEFLRIPPKTVQKEWNTAKIWLYSQISQRT